MLKDCLLGACSIDAPLVSADEAAELSKEIPDWNTVLIDDVERLIRVYEFADFVEAMSFSNKVGDLAEEFGHHPSILIEWGKVEVSWWSHKIKGLHKNDFVFAAKTDAIYNM